MSRQYYYYNYYYFDKLIITTTGEGEIEPLFSHYNIITQIKITQLKIRDT
jgi:F0F1-type ATP synthase epsilon subunit